jgi:hypothetical protein
MESSAVMAMEYLVLDAKYLVKSGFKRLKFMVKVKRSLNSRCPMVTKGWRIMQCRRVEEYAKIVWINLLESACWGGPRDTSV